MVSAPCRNVQWRLVKNLAGQPPSGETTPCFAPGAPLNSIPQGGALGAASTQRPGIFGFCAPPVVSPNGLPAQSESNNAVTAPPTVQIKAPRHILTSWSVSRIQ